MGTFARQLLLKTAGVGVATLSAMALAAQPFNVLTFNWGSALTVSGSAAALALLEGLAGKLTGDKDQASVTR